jgi:hypothetical protein
MDQPLTPEQARAVFDAMAALEDELCLSYLDEGCECRAELMIRRMQAMGYEPGRAWALAVGRLLQHPQPGNPARSFKWNNHVAPTLPVPGAEGGVLVIDPSIVPAGPVTLTGWATALAVRSFEVSSIGLSQSEILKRQTERALRWIDLDAVIFNLPLGVPPIPENGGSGFCVKGDPGQGIERYLQETMAKIRDGIAQRRRKQS